MTCEGFPFLVHPLMEADPVSENRNLVTFDKITVLFLICVSIT